jgi:hypothetical protein
MVVPAPTALSIAVMPVYVSLPFLTVILKT